MAYADGAVVGGSLLVPGIDATARTNWEAIAAVGVGNLKNFAGYALALGYDELEARLAVFDHREQSDGAVFDAHLDGEAAAHFAVVDLERTDLGFALGDGDVAGTVVAHEHQVVFEVHGVVLGEGAARAEQIHDLHGQRVFNLVLAGHGNVAGGEQRGAENDGTHGVFVGGDARPLVVVGHEAKLVAGDKGIKSAGCARGTAHLRRRAIGRNAESDMEFRGAAGKIVLADLGAERAQLVHFEQFHMSAEGDGDEGHVGHDVQHAAVVVTHEAEARGCEGGTDTRRRQPLLNLSPGGFIIEDARDLVKGNLRANEEVGNLGNRTGGTRGEPFAGHGGAVFEPVEGFVIDGGFGLQVEGDDRHAGTLDQRKDGVRECVSGDVEKEHVDVFASALVASITGTCRRVHQPQVDDFDAGTREPRSDLLYIALQALFEPGKLAPISIEADAAQAYAQWSIVAHRDSNPFCGAYQLTTVTANGARTILPSAGLTILAGPSPVCPSTVRAAALSASGSSTETGRLRLLASRSLRPRGVRNACAATSLLLLEVSTS